MNDVEQMLAKQFLLRACQEGYSIVSNSPRTVASEMNVDIYRGETKICIFDDRQLGENWHLRVRTDDSARPDIKNDYNKLFYMFIDLRDLYYIYAAAEPLRGYDQSLGYRAISQYGGYTLAVKGGSRTGELEFGTFLTDRRSSGYGSEKTIRNNIYFDMDSYPLAQLDFVSRSGLLPKEQLITPDNIKYLHGSCSKTMAKEGGLFDEDTKTALAQVITDLEKTQDAFRDVEYRTAAIPAQHARYIATSIFAVKGIFTKQQIDRATLPKGLFAYDVQYSSPELMPEKLWNSVLGRRFGTVVTAKPLTIGEKGYTDFADGDFSLNPEKHCTLKEFQARHKDNER